MPAVAVTDTNNMFGALEFATLASTKGIQPIQGCQFSLRYGTREDRSGIEIDAIAPIVLLAQNETGYGNLLKLNSRMYLRPTIGHPHLLPEDLEEFGAGLICLSGGAFGPAGCLLEDCRGDQAETLMLRLAKCFEGRLYVEIQRHPEPGSSYALRESTSEQWLVEFAYANELPIVATNDVYFSGREMFAAQDALFCIGQSAYVDDTVNRRRLTPEHYFKSQDKMVALFADIPEAVENTIEIAHRCSFKVRKREPILPKFAENESDEMRRQATEGLRARLDVIDLAATEETYWQRLEYELDVVIKMDFSGYFLIVADFIKWAKSNGIPVGPGRGSGAGSLVAYALSITDLDPMRFSLLFERFLNPERVSMPDFDIDFCPERRDEVIAYVQQKYGRDRVAHISTFGALLSRMAIRDVGRVLRIRHRHVDRLAKLIPRDGARIVPIDEALQKEPKLREAAESGGSMKQLFDHGRQIEGLLRNVSTHAAGIVIGDRPIDELTPLYKDPKSEVPATQFNMKWVEQAGLVKFDFLGLKTLTIVQDAVDLIRANGIDLDIQNIPFDDENTFEIYRSASTVAVFQLESSGMKDTLRMMKPTSIEDIVALVALYRPGPMGNIPEYCAVKNGKKQRQKQHPLIDDIVAETHGIIVYQEQVMQIAQRMAGYSLGGADLLRRAMGKKIKAAMDAEKPKFLEGANVNGVEERIAAEVWELMARFAEYGFPKAHAASYGVLSYWTAWLKAHYPVEFMASVMNADLGDTAKLESYVREVKRMEIELLPPCINRSAEKFSTAGGQVAYALGALRNVGPEAMRAIVEARGDRPFGDLFDFASRVELKGITKRSLETLARAGAFDQLDSNRHRVQESLDTLYSYSVTLHSERASKQMSLFGDTETNLPPPKLPTVDEWKSSDRLAAELDAFGFYFSGHPLDQYADSLKEAGVRNISEILGAASNKSTTAKVAGTVAAKHERMSAKGNRYAFVELTDPSGVFEVTLFSDILAADGEKVSVGNSVVLRVEFNLENDQLRIRANSVQSIDEIGSAKISGLRIYFSDAEVPRTIRSILDRGRCGNNSATKGQVCLCPLSRDIPWDAEILLPESFVLNSGLQRALASLGGVVKVEEF